MSDPSTDPPVVTVVSGAPTPEELAAVVTVLSAAAGGAGRADDPGEVRTDRPRVGGWKSYGRTLRRAVQPGPGAWHHFSS